MHSGLRVTTGEQISLPGLDTERAARGVQRGTQHTQRNDCQSHLLFCQQLLNLLFILHSIRIAEAAGEAGPAGANE
jgi:hypothetical protein